MGMAKLNVFVSGYGEPCSLDSDYWIIGIFDCKLQPFKWCNFNYKIPAKCGFAEIRIPPGTYVIMAINEKQRNFTCPVIVSLPCEETKCVKLFQMGYKSFITHKIHAIAALAQQKLITKDLAKKAEKVLTEISAKLPPEKTDFDLTDFVKAKFPKKNPR